MIKVNQASTWRGFVVIASVVLAAAGFGDVVSVTISEGGAVQLGGAVGAIVTAGVGFYDVVRDEYKQAVKKVRDKPWTRS
ncbi:hypothetical protein [Vibrio metschnikovii]|uniref:hypothetical protein n=1 Tax=Vibrio metschnikovii TaxID=28172 RepID=UPI002A603B54|nr:hypothetical protein [Vibrio metschnikovii]